MYRYTELPYTEDELYPLHPKKHIYGVVGNDNKLVKILTDKSRKDCFLEVKLQKEAKNLGVMCPEIYDYYWYNGVFYITMEKIKAKTIKDRFSANEKKVPKWVFEKIREIVDYLWDKGIEYIDITSVNFMVTDDNKIIIIDFGHAYYREGNTIDSYLDDFLNGKNYWNPEMI
jgi:tRNA A-37 threonylcarbamoyl transferase component Bud32